MGEKDADADARLPGLRPLRGHLPRWAVGSFRVERPLYPILVDTNWTSAVHAPGAQEQCDQYRPREAGSPFGQWKWRLHGQDLEVRADAVGRAGGEAEAGG